MDATTNGTQIAIEFVRLRFQLEQANLRAARAEQYAALTDDLAAIISDAQERLARPGRKLDALREILHRDPAWQARRDRTDRQLSARSSARHD